MPDNKQAVLSQLKADWDAFVAAIQAVPRDRFESPDFAGGWSAKDILGHVTTWEAEGAKAIRHYFLTGRKYTYPDVEEYNASEVARKRALTATVVWAEARRVHQELVTLLEGLDESHFAPDGYVARTAREEAVEHYHEHAAQLKARRA